MIKTLSFKTEYSTSEITKAMREQLTALAEPSYKKFQEALIPGCTNMLGVRVPLIRKIAKDFLKTNFTNQLYSKSTQKSILTRREIGEQEHQHLMKDTDESAGRALAQISAYLRASNELYYEEYMLKALLIGELGELLYKNSKRSEQARKEAGVSMSNQALRKEETGRDEFEIMIHEISAFLPKISNWGICDSFCASLKFTKKNGERMWEFLETCITSEQTYFIRFALVMYLDYYIDQSHLRLLYKHFENIKNTDYYVKMAVAWALSMCFVKFPDETTDFLKRHSIDDDTYKMTIRKIRESRQVSSQQKRHLTE